MVLHRWGKGRGFDNPSIYCADQKHLIDKMRMALSKIVAGHEAYS
jgi:uncharacterized protein